MKRNSEFGIQNSVGASLRGAERRGNPEELRIKRKGEVSPSVRPPAVLHTRNAPNNWKFRGKKRKIVDFSNPRGNKKGKIYAI